MTQFVHSLTTCYCGRCSRASSECKLDAFSNFPQNVIILVRSVNISQRAAQPPHFSTCRGFYFLSRPWIFMFSLIQLVIISKQREPSLFLNGASYENSTRRNSKNGLHGIIIKKKTTHTHTQNMIKVRVNTYRQFLLSGVHSGYKLNPWALQSRPVQPGERNSAQIHTEQLNCHFWCILCSHQHFLYCHWGAFYSWLICIFF